MIDVQKWALIQTFFWCLATLRSSQQHSAALRSSQQHSANLSKSQQHPGALSSTKELSTAQGSSQQHTAALSSTQKLSAALSSPQQISANLSSSEQLSAAAVSSFNSTGKKISTVWSEFYNFWIFLHIFFEILFKKIKLHNVPFQTRYSTLKLVEKWGSNIESILFY